MKDKKNGLPKSIYLKGVAYDSTIKDYQKIVDSCIKNHAKFRLLLLKCTCNQMMDYAKQRIEIEIKDPQKKQEFLSLLH